MPDVPVTSGSRPSVIARVSGSAFVSIHEPPGSDADRDHLEALGIEVAQDAACGNTRNRVLGAASAVDDGDSDAGSHKLETLPVWPPAARGAAITWALPQGPRASISR